MVPPCCGHERDYLIVFGQGAARTRAKQSGRTAKYGPILRRGSATREASCAAMGIDWMSRPELTQAIPPAYTEHIGGYPHGRSPGSSVSGGGVTAQSSNVVPMLTLEQMDLAEAAFLKLMKARYPGRPVTVRRLDADTIAERRAARLNQDGEADAA